MTTTTAVTAAVAPPDPANLQGLIPRGYPHHQASCHLLYAFDKNKTAAKAFIRALLPCVQSGKDWGDARPLSLLNIGLTFTGIQTASDLSSSDVKGFPWTFQQGPASSGSQSALGDLGASAPKNWWNGAFPTSTIDCIVHAYAQSTDVLSPFVAMIADAAKTAGVRELTRFEQYFLPDDVVHFGYRDGISEPDLAWPTAWPPDVPYTDPAALNSFVIGYSGSYFGPGPTSGNAGAFAKDGCYVAFRVIAQDTAGFEKYLADNATEAMPSELLAAKVMGRWRNGSPLVLSPDAPSEATKNATQFTYGHDPTGAKCPYSAHIRVSNPRDQPLDASDTPAPRIIRRGAPYGAPEGSNDRGLIGLFLVGNLATQFEKLCGWLNANNFSSVFSPNMNAQDAIAGNRATPGADTTFLGTQLAQFLTTRGTAYCLLPSMTTLTKLAAPSSQSGGVTTGVDFST